MYLLGRILYAAKMARGVLWSNICKVGEPYDAAQWFDRFYADGVSDRATISQAMDIRAASFHYASVEALIARELLHQGVPTDGARVLDIGSGSGHWLRFYREMGASECTGVELAQRPAAALREAFGGEPWARIRCGDAADVVPELGRFNIVNAIGVMFHIVDDAHWRRAVRVLSEALEPDGMLIVGGHFGGVGGINVQFDEERRFNKRLRSARQWRKELRKSGLTDVRIHKNRIRTDIRALMPESHILTARKPPD